MIALVLIAAALTGLSVWYWRFTDPARTEVEAVVERAEAEPVVQERAEPVEEQAEAEDEQRVLSDEVWQAISREAIERARAGDRN